MKKYINTTIVATMLIASLGHASEHGGVDKSLFKSEAAYKAYLSKEIKQTNAIKKLQKQVDKNNCRIVTLEKAVAKLIKEKKQLSTKEHFVPQIEKLPNVFEKPVAESKKKTVCKEKVEKVMNIDRIEESYYKYKKPKRFRVLYKRAGEFEYPVLHSKVVGMLHKGDKFLADMYTKAGWVHKIGGGWVKGYKLSPKVLNRVTKEDVKRWGGHYKTVKVKDCKPAQKNKK